MGGHALPDFIRTRRYSAEELAAFRERRLPALRSFFSGLRLEEPQPLFAKESFGDLDLLLENSDRLPPPLQPEWAEFLAPLRLLHVTVNGPVVSIPVEELQVDLIRTEPSCFDFARRYFSFGDTGNLIGRVAADADLLLGFQGLYRRGPDGKASSLLTLDWDEALGILGYDPAAHAKGFSTPEESYAFVASSPAFRLAAFDPDRRRARDNRRDKLRPLYREFPEWAQAQGFPYSSAESESALESIRLLSWQRERLALSPSARRLPK